MITVRNAADRGVTRLPWLDSRHTFSFAEYFDPEHVGFRSLRVINDDRVREGAGFGRHPHRDMEIVSYVLEGAIAHRDSLGTGSTLRPGDVQRMTAGTGILHSEFNPSESEPLRFLQIWILPERPGLAPGYEQRAFPESERRGRLRLVAAREPGSSGAVTIHQDASIYAGLLGPGDRVEHPLSPGRGAWLQVARGSVALNGVPLAEGDGARVEDEPILVLDRAEEAEVLLFDLA